MTLAKRYCTQVVGQCCRYAGSVMHRAAACRIMREYMPKVGTMGHDMMFRSTTIQVGCQALLVPAACAERWQQSNGVI